MNGVQGLRINKDTEDRERQGSRFNSTKFNVKFNNVNSVNLTPINVNYKLKN